MKIELTPTSASDEPTLSRLVQLYAYDFSEFMEWDVSAEGLFYGGDPLALCWSEPWRHAYFFRADAMLAGFAIVDERSRLTKDPEVMDMSQFFVLRKYRRKGVGLACAAQVFDLYPRKWEVREVAKNVAATSFWRRAIGAYTRGEFVETQWDDARWRGPVQSFDARG